MGEVPQEVRPWWGRCLKRCDLGGGGASRGETLVGEVPQEVRPWWGRCLKR